MSKVRVRRRRKPFKPSGTMFLTDQGEYAYRSLRDIETNRYNNQTVTTVYEYRLVSTRKLKRTLTWSKEERVSTKEERRVNRIFSTKGQYV